MTFAASADQVRQWCGVAARAASAKKGEETLILAVAPMLAITDAFVITTGANARQVRTIAEEVEDNVKVAGGPSPLHVEGLDDARWVLIDYGDFVVHVFLGEVRRFYDLERLWADAERWDWDQVEAGDVAEAEAHRRSASHGEPAVALGVFNPGH